ncbi:NRDE family protein [Undibacterium parvum]|uniref:NRDE family protein n=1 Tax=Undibacterium parvum TaxID=401471 RepID=A0A3S9HNE0_9BURK|nr:NRDE family protein [Undibacterium parvum]AZP13605.1 NRDE family protein [Undibacterium parvum]
MCLIVFAWKLIPATPLIAASNRDEYYERPSAAAAVWENSPQIFAGRDLRSGGTWMGLTNGNSSDTSQRKFAAITNIRAPSETRAEAASRGELVANYLGGNLSARAYVDTIRPQAHLYNGFNLLLADQDDLIWFSNRNQDDVRNGQPLAAGIYGLSNASLDTPWSKVVKTKAEFASLICQQAPDQAYFEMLSNTTPAPDCRLPDTGISLAMERLLSAACIESPNYGTRVSTLVKMHAEQPAQLIEKFLR